MKQYKMEKEISVVANGRSHFNTYFSDAKDHLKNQKGNVVKLTSTPDTIERAIAVGEKLKLAFGKDALIQTTELVGICEAVAQPFITITLQRPA